MLISQQNHSWLFVDFTSTTLWTELLHQQVRSQRRRSLEKAPKSSITFPSLWRVQPWTTDVCNCFCPRPLDLRSSSLLFLLKDPLHRKKLFLMFLSCSWDIFSHDEGHMVREFRLKLQRLCWVFVCDEFGPGKSERPFASYLQAAVTSPLVVSGSLFSYFRYKFPLSQTFPGEERSPDTRGGKGGEGGQGKGKRRMRGEVLEVNWKDEGRKRTRGAGGQSLMKGITDERQEG